MNPITLTIFNGERCVTTLEDLEAAAHAITRKSQAIPITFPARPVNGGRFELAPAKRGEWAVEPKLNGWRVMVHAPTRTAFTRRNEPLTIASEFTTAMDKLHTVWRGNPAMEWFDCEGLERRHGIGRGTLIVLDTLIPGSYRDRRYHLRAAFGQSPGIEVRPDPANVILVPSFPRGIWTPPTPDKVMDIYTRLRELNAEWNAPYFEGIVMKKMDSAYPIQTRSATEEFAGWMKHRFLN